MASAIEAQDLVKRYRGRVTALDRMSLKVPAGTVFAMLGPNGAGKSTTVRILSTLSRPDSGSARVAGRDVLAEPLAVRRAIGVVGQKHGFDPEATGRENLYLQGNFYAIARGELRRRVESSLERFDLQHAADRRAKTYSGGMQRRLDVAMGLLHRPQVLFLDEPTTGLDPEARAQMWEEVRRLREQEQMTILLTTHYMEEADQLASALAIVDRGHVVAEGAPEALKRELEGDTIEVELAGHGDALGALARVREISAPELHGNTLRARAPDGAIAIPAVLAALEQRGVRVSSVTLSRPSLEQVYMRHAGRAFNSANQDHGEKEAA